jgi:surface antigen
MIRFHQVWQYFQQRPGVSKVTASVVLVCTFVLALLGSAFGPSVVKTFAQSTCAQGDQTYTVVSGDTLSAIGRRYNQDWQKLASYNKLSNPHLIFINQRICIPGSSEASSGSTTTTTSAPVNVTTAPTSSGSAKGSSNPYAYPQCTWWASERTHQLYGYYVPWTMNANAHQWVARAYEFGWNVSSTPTVGSIVVLQPNVQGASYLGHVAVVEKILDNGNVLTSNTNWYPTPYQVTYVEITPGSGVSFLHA